MTQSITTANHAIERTAAVIITSSFLSAYAAVVQSRPSRDGSCNALTGEPLGAPPRIALFIAIESATRPQTTLGAMPSGRNPCSLSVRALARLSPTESSVPRVAYPIRWRCDGNTSLLRRPAFIITLLAEQRAVFGASSGSAFKKNGAKCSNRNARTAASNSAISYTPTRVRNAGRSSNTTPGCSSPSHQRMQRGHDRGQCGSFARSFASWKVKPSAALIAFIAAPTATQSPIIKSMHLSSSTTHATASVPKHDDIAQCARELWIESGRPANRDEAIWLEAERRLVAARRAPAVIATILPVLSRRRSLRRPI